VHGFADPDSRITVEFLRDAMVNKVQSGDEFYELVQSEGDKLLQRRYPSPAANELGVK